MDIGQFVKSKEKGFIYLGHIRPHYSLERQLWDLNSTHAWMYSSLVMLPVRAGEELPNVNSVQLYGSPLDIRPGETPAQALGRWRNTDYHKTLIDQIKSGSSQTVKITLPKNIVRVKVSGDDVRQIRL